MLPSTTPPLSPQAWCRRILTSLRQRQMQGREAGHLEMLLTFFIELNPTVEAFDQLLDQYADDARPAIAEAAALLRNSWQRGRVVGAAVAPPLTRQETLRAVGALADEAGARAVYATLAADSVQVDFCGTGAQLSMSAAELRQEVAARRALRGQLPPSEPGSPAGYETRLRAVGAVLDGLPPQTYQLAVTRRTVVVEGDGGHYHIYDETELAELLAAAAGWRESPPAS